MPRLDAVLTQGLMNPTYQDSLGQAATQLGMLGGQIRQDRQNREAAQALQGLSFEEMLAQRVANSTNPDDAVRWQKLLEEQALANEKRAEEVEKAKQGEAQSLAKAELSILGSKFQQAVADGDTEKAESLRNDMESIAVGARVDADPYLGEPLKPVTAAQRYLNLGKQGIFDTKTRTFVRDQTQAILDVAETRPEPKDFHDDLAKQYEEGGFTDESWEQYLQKYSQDADPFAASSLLKTVDVVQRNARIAAGANADVSRNMQTIDEIIAIAPDSWDDAALTLVTRYLPWTEGMTIEDQVSTLKANIAFDRLQKMRDNSKTGGALGQVSEKELKLLQDNLAALNPRSRNFIPALQKVRKHYQVLQDLYKGPPEGGNGGNFALGANGTQVWFHPETNEPYNWETGQPMSNEELENA